MPIVRTRPVDAIVERIPPSSGTASRKMVPARASLQGALEETMLGAAPRP